MSKVTQQLWILFSALCSVEEGGAKAKKIRTWEEGSNDYQNSVAERDSWLFSNANTRVGGIELCEK